MVLKHKKVLCVKEKHSSYGINGNTITIPVEVFETAYTKEDIEDWLLANDPKFIKRIRKASENDLARRDIINRLYGIAKGCKLTTEAFFQMKKEEIELEHREI